MLKKSEKFLFKVSISRILDNMRDSFPSVLPMQFSGNFLMLKKYVCVCLTQTHHHHFWVAPLTVRSATHSQQPPQRSVLSHAASAWWGFTTADDHQRLEAVIRRGIRSGFCSADQVSFVRASGCGIRSFV